MNRQKEQSRSSANTAEVAVSIGFVLAWLLGAVVLLTVLPSGGEFGGREELSALRGVQLADQRMLGHRPYLGASAGFSAHDREAWGESNPTPNTSTPPSTTGIDDTGTRYPKDWSQPRAVCQSEISEPLAPKLSC